MFCCMDWSHQNTSSNPSDILFRIEATPNHGIKESLRSTTRPAQRRGLILPQ